MTKAKHDTLHELILGLATDSTAESLRDNLRCVTYAPQLGYRSWIFKYKNVRVALSDIGNGNYAYDYPVSWWDIALARLHCLGSKLGCV